MGEELRRRLLLAKELQQKEDIEQDLPTGMFRGFVNDFQTPDWVARSLSRFRRMDSQPNFSIATENLTELGDWVESIRRGINLGEEPFCKTGLQNFPWLKYSCRRPAWAEALLRTIGRDLVLLSADRKTMLVVFEEEYEYIAFTASDLT
ncbi:hypothetical protein HHX38_04020 [Streptomyces sp. PKU-MA01144]|uniref:hypothetical protein n=1 Tax=Streptomyces sp. PKU-MA01144 TaxID=2729138 RepID=UPI00147A400A|nr:hypothetical protein [Streptomyces sp. PKU-MA01144]NNJ03309.1 hypothetical protein [Streptomyces sp. PKU-MA01144]